MNSAPPFIKSTQKDLLHKIKGLFPPIPFFAGVVFLDACDTGGLPPEGVLDADLEVAGLPALLGVLGVAGFDETMGLLGVVAD